MRRAPTSTMVCALASSATAASRSAGAIAGARACASDSSLAWTKPSSSATAPPGRRPGLAQGGQALAMVDHLPAQPRAEHLLQLAEAGIVERLGEAHQGRGLHAGPRRDLRRRAEGHVVEMGERVVGDLLQPLRQGRTALAQQRDEAVEILRSRG